MLWKWRGVLLNAMESNCPANNYFVPPVRGGPFQKGKGHATALLAHISLENCSFYTKNESVEHLNLKAGLRLGKQSRQGAFLPEIRQIADLFDRWPYSAEVQCSPLSQESSEVERTPSYRQHDHQVLWLLGKKLWLKTVADETAKGFSLFQSNMGFHLWELDEKAELRLKYLIHEDFVWTSSVQGQILSWPRMPVIRLARPFRAGLVIWLQDPEIWSLCSSAALLPAASLDELQARLSKGDNLQPSRPEDFYPQVHQSKLALCQITRFPTPYYQHPLICYYQAEKISSFSNYLSTDILCDFSFMIR